MKKTLAILTCSCALGAAATANAAPDTKYLGVGGGLTILNDSTLSAAGSSTDADFDTGLGVALTAGYEFTAARAELEFGYRKNDIDSFSVLGSVPVSGDVTAKSLMMNVYHDFYGTDGVVPFIGIGAGLATLDVNDVAFLGIQLNDADDTVFAWQLAAGLGFQLTEKTTLDLSYRYFATADPDFQGIAAEYGGHSLMAGIRFAF